MDTFSLVIGIGLVVGVAWAMRGLKDPQALQLIDFSLVMLAGSLLGSRGVYVALNWGYYQRHGLEILQLWAGGLSGVGALLGGVLAFGLLAWARPEGLWKVANQLFLAWMIVVVAAWLGCWLEGVAYGPQTGSVWGVPARDEWGEYSRRFPTQLVGAALTLAWFWLLESRAAARKDLSRWLPALGLLGIGLILLALSFLRADPTLTWHGFRLDTWGGFGVVMVSLLWMLCTWRIKTR